MTKMQLQQLAAIMLVAATALPQTAVAQGSLTPPGPPAPTMKSLQQISDQIAAQKTEARIPLSHTNFDANGTIWISQPGSYYLTENLTGDVNSTGFSIITVLAANVTLDLNGFTVTQPKAGTFVSGISTIFPSPTGNLTVRNGTIAGPSVRTAGTELWQGTFSDVQTYGIHVGNSSTGVLRFENLTLRNWGFAGINLNAPVDGKPGHAMISNCTFAEIGQIGFRGRASIIRDCSISKVGTHGIEGDNNVVENVLIESAGGNGIQGNNNIVRSVNMRWVGLDGMVGGGHSISDLNVTGARNGLAIGGSTIVKAILAYNRSNGATGLNNVVIDCLSRNNGARGFTGDFATYQNVTAFANATDGLGGNDCSVDGAVLAGNASHGFVGNNATVRGIKASNNTGAGIFADNSTISECTANKNGDDGIRGVGSVIANCRAFGNDTTAGGYAASGIYWANGKIHNSLADTAFPAIP